MIKSSSLYTSNLTWLKSNFTAIYERLSIVDATQFEIPNDLNDELIIDGEIMYESFESDLVEAFIRQSTQQPRRVRTPRFETEHNDTSLEIIADNFVDKHDAPFVDYLPIFSQYKSEKRKIVSHDYAVLGALMLYPFSKQLLNGQSDDINEHITTITLIEPDIRNLSILLNILDFAQFISILKTKKISLQLILHSDQDDIINHTYSYISQAIPTALYGLTVLMEPKASPLLLSLHSWFFSHLGIGHRFLGTIGTSSDELNQVVQGLWSATSIDASDSHQISGSNLVNDEHHVCIVAGGPSLDNYIETIRSISHKMNVVAAGSSIGSLLKQSIVPDACVFLERGSTVYFSLKSFIEEGYDISNIILICSETTDPRLKSLFKYRIVYHRPGSSLASLFPKEQSSYLLHAGPEAANAAFDSCLKLGFKNYHLFGCDFSAPTRSKARAANAIGYSPRRLDEPVISNLNNNIFTQPSLSASRDAFEATAMSMNESFTIFRYGEGLTIRGTINVKEPHESIKSTKLSWVQVTQHLQSRKQLSNNNTIEICKSLSQSISQYLNKVRQLNLNLISWTSDTHKQAAQLLYSYPLDEEESNYDLCARRLLRAIVFHTLVPLFDSAYEKDSDQLDSCKKYVDQSIDWLETFYKSVLCSIEDQSTTDISISSWDPDTFKKLLINKLPSMTNI